MGWLRARYARTPLRVKLVATVLLLVIAALVGSGFAAVATMRSYLVGRVDDQLRTVADHTAHDGPGIRGDGDADHSRQPDDFVLQVTNATGHVVSLSAGGLITADRPLPELPTSTAAETAKAGRHAFTVDASKGDEQWRVLAQPVRLSDGTTGTLYVAQSLTGVEHTLEHLTLLLLVIGAVCVVVLAGVGYVVVRANLRPLRAVEHTAAEIAAGDLSHRVPDADPRTEVGQLSRALNAMLAEIESAFAARAASETAARSSEERMRRFVADASHELRTPLTTIRGFAELYRQGAVDGEADVRRFMSRIEDEAKRMGLLVEDLLLLARLDEERPFARTPVDLLALARDAVHDARAVDPQRPIGLEVGPSDPPPVVVGDEARLRQVLANLVTNALRHTPPGTPVTVGVRTEGDSVLLTVADPGPGLSEEAAARAFERFYRGDPSRGRREGSTGLGLAIVAALVAGHGGTVDVQTAPGRGATFRVTLPLARAGS